MKRTVLIAIAVMLLAALAAVPAMAKPYIIKGEVTAIDTATGVITLDTGEVDPVLVTVPEGFDLTALVIGDQVIVKGQLQEDGSVLAYQINKLEVEEDTDTDPDEGEGEDTSEGSKATDSAYCNGDKTEPHPMAAALAERYDVTTEWVMGYFCDGYGMGAIMLALRTQQINGADPDALLAQRAEGKGWGVIWKELKMIGSEADVHTPPGQLKKQEHGNH